MEKRCCECKTIKDLDEFHKDKRRSDGRNGRCKNCRKKDYIKKSGKEPKGISVADEKAGKSQIKIRCNRSSYKEISIDDCVPGCNDLCKTCENKQMQNIKAGDDTYSNEEEARIRHLSGFGSSAVLAAEVGLEAE